ncbi:zf-HC2 domain-containing protein [Streptomyces sp. HNM0574]|uniref:zf-HC2 domain-containing protein n=1 Tax=Streptomyces sp. HNM0574 TaxID=2714954 RepID=UPI00146A3B1D|nr:zf-HC2 domain-containing protein [Streptomyces sp. HNM0574]NLU70012.1 hypothetical protein [Streptomyces sp. HNM0574]
MTDHGTDHRTGGAGGVGLLVRLLRRMPEEQVKALWLAEIEGASAEEISRRLGTGPDVTVLLLHRAREGVRQAYLREQPGAPLGPACAPHWARLPAYARGAASVRATQALDAHLAGCADCRERARALARAGRRIPVTAALLELSSAEDGAGLRPLGGRGTGTGVVLGPLRFGTRAAPARPPG